MTTQLESFKVIGISVRTTNENGQATKDIPALWKSFFMENISAKILNKVSDDLYCVYTDYEKDHTKPYTTILGYKVNSDEILPEGLTEKSIDTSSYKVFNVKGKQSEGFIFNEWLKIWNTEINRAYTADFEIYGAKAQNPEDAEVDIFIALK